MDRDLDLGDSEDRNREQFKAKIIDTGPPPDMKKRHLIFDSLAKIISRNFGKSVTKPGETRGTYVYTWGAGYHGQLGRKFVRGKKKYATVPRRVDIDMALRQIACGGLHTAAVTDSGAVYTWGDARALQLGYQPHGFTNQATPMVIESLEAHTFITKVACGQSHTVALTDKGGGCCLGACPSLARVATVTAKQSKRPRRSTRWVCASWT